MRIGSQVLGWVGGSGLGWVGGSGLGWVGGSGLGWVGGSGLGWMVCNFSSDHPNRDKDPPSPLLFLGGGGGGVRFVFTWLLERAKYISFYKKRLTCS